jgi:hypothetical protein
MGMTTQCIYLAAIQNAKLESKEKVLLYFYATTFNLKERKPSFYSQRKICALNAMAPGTYTKSREKLKELGWIKVVYRGQRKSCQVTLYYWQDDPMCELRSWATWHLSKRIAEEAYWEIVSKLNAQGIPIDTLLEFADSPEEGIAFSQSME